MYCGDAKVAGSMMAKFRTTAVVDIRCVGHSCNLDNRVTQQLP